MSGQSSPFKKTISKTAGSERFLRFCLMANDQLFVAYRSDGVHVGGFLSREIAEADTDDGADDEGDDDAPQGYAGGQAKG